MAPASTPLPGKSKLGGISSWLGLSRKSKAAEEEGGLGLEEWLEKHQLHHHAEV